MTEKSPDLLVRTALFQELLGKFYILWSSVEAEASFLIGELLGLPYEETHLITARMEFARKVDLIRDLVKRKKHPRAGEIKGALNAIQNNAKRNVFAHATLVSDHEKIFFVERGWQRHFVAETHEFTIDEFAKHVLTFATSARELDKACAFRPGQLHDFLRAALSAPHKSKTSPTPPIDKA